VCIFFTGKEGIRQIFEDQLEKGKDVSIIAGSAKVEDILKYFFPRYERIRKEKNMHTRMIKDDNTKEKTKYTKIALNKMKYLKNFNDSPMSQYIYGNNVAIILWTEKPFAVLIREKEIAEGFRQNFEFLWNLNL
jgi:hypothetical protein